MRTYCDQDALNVVLGNLRVPLHSRWNCMNSLYLLPHARDVFGLDKGREACSWPPIVHFEGPQLAKPWHYLSKHPFREGLPSAPRRHTLAEFAVEGQTWPDRLLTPLPTPATITVLGRSRLFGAWLDPCLARLRSIR